MQTLLFPLMAFAIACCITPGPNNMMLTASGANFGFVKTIPHILGIVFGMVVMYVVAALGLGTLFTLYPQVQTLLKIGGIAYLFYLSWKIAMAAPGGDSRSRGKPLTFMQAAAFQFLNPKAFMIVVSSLSTFTLSGDRYITSAIVVTIVFIFTALPSISIWAGFGTAIGRLLKNPRGIRVFNISMGGLTAGSALLLL
jgi:threonine/homoserine/homoserine lactone efflux protein